VAARIVWAWVLTIPASAFMAALSPAIARNHCLTRAARLCHYSQAMASFKLRKSAVLALVILLGASAAPCQSRAFDARKPGPYPVGVTTTVFVDNSRTDALTKKPRTLVTEIWYPAADDAKRMPKNRYRDFFGGKLPEQLEKVITAAYRMPLEELEKSYTQEAVRDAPVRTGKFPLVIFSHGNGGSRHQNTFWCDYLASHGYVIASADHTGNARITIIDGEIIRMDPEQRRQSATDRPLDMSFLLDQLKKWNAGGDKRFAGRVDTDAVAATGMSFGSFAAVRAADIEPRYRAVIGMAAGAPARENVTVPILMMLGHRDRTIGDAGNAVIRANYARNTGPAFLLELKNGGHYSFTDMFKINPAFGDGVGAEFTPRDTTYEIVNSYSVAFLGIYLKGQKDYLKFLETNHWPEAMEWKTAGVR
jgi:dienelactone hydrolase